MGVSGGRCPQGTMRHEEVGFGGCAGGVFDDERLLCDRGFLAGWRLTLVLKGCKMNLSSQLIHEYGVFSCLGITYSTTNNHIFSWAESCHRRSVAVRVDCSRRCRVLWQDFVLPKGAVK